MAAVCGGTKRGGHLRNKVLTKTTRVKEEQSVRRRPGLSFGGHEANRKNVHYQPGHGQKTYGSDHQQEAPPWTKRKKEEAWEEGEPGQ